MGFIKIADGAIKKACAAVLTVGAELVAQGIEETDMAGERILEVT